MQYILFTKSDHPDQMASSLMKMTSPDKAIGLKPALFTMHPQNTLYFMKPRN